MNDNQIAKYCDEIRETTLRQLYKIQNQRKEISMLHKKCAYQRAEVENLRCVIDDLCNNTEIAKAEAFKEFAEAYKEQIENCTGMFTDEGFYIPRDAVLNSIDFIYERLAGEG